MSPGRIASFNPANPTSNIRQLLEAQTTFVSFTTPAITGALAQIRHDLGRIPFGYQIVKGPYMTYQHGWNLADTAWDATYIYVRFSILDAPLTLAIF